MTLSPKALVDARPQSLLPNINASFLVHRVYHVQKWQPHPTGNEETSRSARGRSAAVNHNETAFKFKVQSEGASGGEETELGRPTVPYTVTAVKITGLYGQRPACNRNRKEFSRGSYGTPLVENGLRFALMAALTIGSAMEGEVEVPVINDHQSDSIWWAVAGSTTDFASNYLELTRSSIIVTNKQGYYGKGSVEVSPPSNDHEGRRTLSGVDPGGFETAVGMSVSPGKKLRRDGEEGRGVTAYGREHVLVLRTPTPTRAAPRALDIRRRRNRGGARNPRPVQRPWMCQHEEETAHATPVLAKEEQLHDGGATIGPSDSTTCPHCVHTPNTPHRVMPRKSEPDVPFHRTQYRRARRAGVISDTNARLLALCIYPSSTQWKIGSMEMKTHPSAHRSTVVPPIAIQLHIPLVLVVCTGNEGQSELEFWGFGKMKARSCGYGGRYRRRVERGLRASSWGGKRNKVVETDHSTFHLLRAASRSSRGAEEKDTISAEQVNVEKSGEMPSRVERVAIARGGRETMRRQLGLRRYWFWRDSRVAAWNGRANRYTRLPHNVKWGASGVRAMCFKRRAPEAERRGPGPPVMPPDPIQHASCAKATRPASTRSSAKLESRPGRKERRAGLTFGSESTIYITILTLKYCLFAHRKTHEVQCNEGGAGGNDAMLRIREERIKRGYFYVGNTLYLTIYPGLLNSGNLIKAVPDASVSGQLKEEWERKLPFPATTSSNSPPFTTQPPRSSLDVWITGCVDPFHPFARRPHRFAGHTPPPPSLAGAVYLISRPDARVRIESAVLRSVEDYLTVAIHVGALAAVYVANRKLRPLAPNVAVLSFPPGIHVRFTTSFSRNAQREFGHQLRNPCRNNRPTLNTPTVGSPRIEASDSQKSVPFKPVFEVETKTLLLYLGVEVCT
ncbi:hypothetical protein C8F04DRAFT_1174885 [Mycena alexandri]|uniref:Uncharacterized protein n=1 Tax=Mycena alexandri TaxID=1745969 RepID=A0AAD6XDX1_9AGAR|nr:hypothetical protein C8F04DRAFT_1174885 [Mycena alexandri]